MANITTRVARPDDSTAMAHVESLCWPAASAGDEPSIRQRCLVFPEGQRVAEADGEIVGASFAQRISARFLHRTPIRYDRLTDRGTFVASHHPDGEIYQLVSLSVLPAARGARLGRTLIDGQLAFARSLRSTRRIIGFTRPVGYHRHPDLSITQYTTLLDDEGQAADPILALHFRAGARLVSTHACYRDADELACGFGVLIEYPVNPSRPT